ncbi:hypothetical protein J1605_018564 [Eschrichtius robustus]|uniref:Uncharacterized protein n=1 Tax=Eschrichtius robustus TaxID=9764 RepID=A0AB34HV96_ESCRO|nr:hypothetical protein J1605_018564 [Eschrichtius robustus]
MGAEEVGRLEAVTLSGTGARRLGAREPPPRPGSWGRSGRRRRRRRSRGAAALGPLLTQAAEDRRRPQACRPKPPTASMIAAQLLAYYFTELKDDQVKKLLRLLLNLKTWATGTASWNKETRGGHRKLCS